MFGINIQKNSKKGAMFGLDARIALAIFGALSVISGAALYSAIQESKVTSLSVELSEIAKAIEAYMLDTGIDLSETSAAKDLKESTVPGWKGPYLSYEYYNSLDSHFAHQTYDRIAFSVRTSMENGFDYCNTNPNDTCYHWIFLGEVHPDVYNALDLKIDGAVDKTKGKIISRNLDQLVYRATTTLKQY